MSAVFNKRLNKEIQLYKLSNFIFPNLILQPTEDLTLWYFIVYDLKETEYENGIYLGKVKLPDKYPFKAPDFYFLTPSGRFEINKRLCTSFTGYHQELYSPSWNIASMCAGLISFMTDSFDNPDSKGIGGISTTFEFKRNCAYNSKNYIKTNNNILNIFETYFKEYYDILHFN